MHELWTSAWEAIIQSNLRSKVTKWTKSSGRIINVEIGEIRLFRIADSQGLLSFRSLKSGLFATFTTFRLSRQRPSGSYSLSVVFQAFFSQLYNLRLNLHWSPLHFSSVRGSNIWISHIIHYIYGFVSQVEGKDSELRELKSKLSSLQDQHEQAQSKVRAHFRLFSFVSTPCCYRGVWSPNWDGVITLTFDIKIYEKDPCLSWSLFLATWEYF